MSSYQIIGLALTAVGIILSFYTIINRQNASFKEEINKKFDTLNNRVEIADRNAAVGFEKVSGQFNLMSMQVNNILQNDILELRSKVSKLESGQDGWSKELRERSHELRGIVDKNVYEIALLKKDVNDQTVKFELELEILRARCKELSDKNG